MRDYEKIEIGVIMVPIFINVANTWISNGVVPYYYVKKFVILGETFVLGSVKRGIIQNVTEVKSGLKVLTKEECPELTLKNIRHYIDVKLSQKNVSLQDIILQSTHNIRGITLWQTSLLIGPL